MGTFTMTLSEIIDTYGATDAIVNGVTKVVGVKLGLDDYPLHDPTHRDELNGKIIDHYYNQEIGMETLGQFQLAMRRRMNEIMPAYNMLYASLAIQFDPLSTINMHTVSVADTVQETQNQGTNASTSASDSNSRSVQSDTPQTMLSGDEDYASSAADANSHSSGSSDVTESATGNANTNANGTTDVTGYQGVASDLLMRYRESIINVDLMIIRELEDLFMLIWDTGDTYTNYNGRSFF